LEKAIEHGNMNYVEPATKFAEEGLAHLTAAKATTK
jgi:hypothetical protein